MLFLLQGMQLHCWNAIRSRKFRGSCFGQALHMAALSGHLEAHRIFRMEMTSCAKVCHGNFTGKPHIYIHLLGKSMVSGEDFPLNQSMVRGGAVKVWESW